MPHGKGKGMFTPVEDTGDKPGNVTNPVAVAARNKMPGQHKPSIMAKKAARKTAIMRRLKRNG